MALETTFAAGQAVPATFLNDQQQADSGSAWGITLANTGTTLELKPAEDGSATGQSAIRINGVVRYITATVSLVSPGSGTWDIYAVLAGAEAASGVTLEAQAHPGTPGTTKRKIGECKINGGKMEWLYGTVATVPGHGALHGIAGADPIQLGEWTSFESMGAGVTGIGAQARLELGQVVRLKGYVDNTGSPKASPALLFNLAPAFRPSTTRTMSSVVASGSWNAAEVFVEIGGAFYTRNGVSFPAGGIVPLDGLTYTL